MGFVILPKLRHLVLCTKSIFCCFEPGCLQWTNLLQSNDVCIWVLGYSTFFGASSNYSVSFKKCLYWI